MHRSPLALLLVVALLAAGVIASITADSPDPRPPAAAWPVVPRLDAAASTTPEAPAQLTATGIREGRVTLSWQPSPAGPEPTGYLIEGGLQPGEVLGQLPLGAVPEAVVDLPAGVLYLRVYTLAGALRSAASNEVRVVVGALEPPSAPAGLLGLVSGDGVTVTWRNTFAGGAPSRLWLEVTGAAAAAAPLEPVEMASYTGVPPGTYFVRLYAENDAGRSQPSPAITLQVPDACSGAPGPVPNVRAWRSGSTVTVDWDPPASGAAATSYSVQVSGAIEARLDTTARRVSGEVPPGHYAVQVVAVNACGQGPAQSAVDWTTVVRTGPTVAVHFAPVPGVGAYRVFWSTSRDAVVGLTPDVRALDVAASPAVLPEADPSTPVYVRIFSAHGPVAGAGGQVAIAPAFELTRYTGWSESVTPALFDANGDGCLDLVGAWGRCDGSFERYALGTAGLQALAVGPKARDSRFADFTGDGIVDVFTNVYTRADDLTVKASLHVGLGDGTFTEDAGVAALQIRGYGETVLAADFDNDGDVDLFLPHYTHLDDGGRNWLLVNDGKGRFHDAAAAAGVAVNGHFPPEGAQAIDVNADGWVDILVASHLFINNGDLTFTDRAPDQDVPVRFDEGLRLADIDLDGDFDLLHHDTYVTRLHRFDGQHFSAGEVIDGSPGQETYGYGLNVCDLNGDGYEDLLVAQNYTVTTVARPRVLLNVGGHLLPSDVLQSPETYNDTMACADLDGSGLPDIVGRWADMAAPTPQAIVPSGYHVHHNRGAAGAAIRLRVVDGLGRWNQQGRLVRIRPLAGPARTLSRVVESGSGYMAQNGYDLLVATPWPGTYEIQVRFAHGWVRTTADPGAVLTIRADGTVVPGLH